MSNGGQVEKLWYIQERENSAAIENDVIKFYW